jgi:hypothetical protein
MQKRKRRMESARTHHSIRFCFPLPTLTAGRFVGVGGSPGGRLKKNHGDAPAEAHPCSIGFPEEEQDDTYGDEE